MTRAQFDYDLVPRRRIRYRACPVCGKMVTTNALGRLSHVRACAEETSSRSTVASFGARERSPC
jgi:hypothetical protein